MVEVSYLFDEVVSSSLALLHNVDQNDMWCHQRC